MQNEKGKQLFDEIMEWVLSAETIALAGHTNPDGDAIGACLALGGALEKGREAGAGHSGKSTRINIS